MEIQHDLFMKEAILGAFIILVTLGIVYFSGNLDITGRAVYEECTNCTNITGMTFLYLGTSNDTTADVYVDSGFLGEYEIINNSFTAEFNGDELQVTVGNDSSDIDVSCDSIMGEGDTVGNYELTIINSSIDETCVWIEEPDEYCIDNDGDGYNITNETLCTSMVTVESDGNIIGPEGDLIVNVMAAEMTYGAGGPEIDVTVKLFEDGSGTQLFGGEDVDGGETYNTILNSETAIAIEGRAKYGDQYDKTYRSDSGTEHVQVLVRGDELPDYAPFGDQQSLSFIMECYTDDEGLIDIGDNEVLLLFEFADVNGAAADFQDLVVLLTFEPDDYPCNICGPFDCNDNDEDTHPGATEICDGVDNDCSCYFEENEELCGTGRYCINATCVTECGDGETAGDEECDDGNTDDGDGCDSECKLEIICSDNDEDGVTDCDGDCNDNNDTVYPGADDGNCNGVDEDCDGIADDDYVNTPTSCGVGACSSTGELVCIDGELQDTCAAGNGTADNNCNGIDDDCDGDIDEDYVITNTSCGVGACVSSGQLTCVNGLEQDSCIAGIPGTELCEGLIDEDCDGVVDEDCGCVNGQTRACGSDIGECEKGIETCVDGDWNGECIGEIIPLDEVCDGLDNNCDNEIDEDVCPIDDDGDGFNSTVDCDETNSSIHLGADDSNCNGVDEDCDGVADDDYIATSSYCGIGECAAAGQIECVAGELQDTCVAGSPSIETCNYLDDDCDNNIDEDFALLGQLCIVGIGACERLGNFDCSVNGTVECDAEPGIPDNEVCGNGIDDDCDGGDLVCRTRGSGGGKSWKPKNETNETNETIGLLIPKRVPDSFDLTVEIKKVPLVVSLDDGLTVTAVVKNKGNRHLTDIRASIYAYGWDSSTVFIDDILRAGEQKEVTFSIKPNTCKFGVDLRELKDRVELIVVAGNDREQTRDTVEFDVNIDEYEILYDKAGNHIKMCFVVNNKGKEARNKLEMQFGIFDKKDEIFLDYFTDLKVPSDEIFIKQKEYYLDYIPETKIYVLKSDYYENGNIFSSAGTAVSAIELQETNTGFWSLFF